MIKAAKAAVPNDNRNGPPSPMTARLLVRSPGKKPTFTGLGRTEAAAKGSFPGSTFVGAPDLANRQASDRLGCPERVSAERLQVDLGAEQSGRQPLDNAPLPRGDGIEPCAGG